MDNQTEVIKQQMVETRESLAEKLETLEDKVVDTVHGAADAVTGTVDSVKDAVNATVVTVKDSVQETVETVKETFNLRHQVEQHPWAMLAGSLAIGYVGGRLLLRNGSGGTAEPGQAYRSQSATECNGAGSLDQAPVQQAVSPSPNGRPHWLEEIGQNFGPELHRLKALALGTMMGIARDMLCESAPREIGDQLHEVMDQITAKVGGEPLHSPVLGESRPSCQSSSPALDLAG